MKTNLNNLNTENILEICDFINAKLCINLEDHFKDGSLLENGAKTKFIEAIFYDSLDYDYLYLDNYYNIAKISNKDGDTKRVLINWCGVIDNKFQTAKIMISCDSFGGYTLNVLDNVFVERLIKSTIFYEWFINFIKN